MRKLLLSLALVVSPIAMHAQSSGLPAPALANTPTVCTTPGQVPTGIDVYGNALGCGYLNAAYVTGAARWLENDVVFSATPTLNPAASLNYLVLTGNVTSSTLSAGTAGQITTIVVCQDATGLRSFAWPTNVKGGFSLAGLGANKCGTTTLSYVSAASTWYAVSSGALGL